MIEYLKETGHLDETNYVLNLRSLPLKERTDVLDKLVYWETMSITMLAPDEFLGAVPEARQAHNAFFDKVNHTINFTKFQEDRNKITLEQKENVLSSLLLACSKHSALMEELWNTNVDKKFL